jgi:hypothetical protein
VADECYEKVLTARERSDTDSGFSWRGLKTGRGYISRPGNRRKHKPDMFNTTQIFRKGGLFDV